MAKLTIISKDTVADKTYLFCEATGVNGILKEAPFNAEIVSQQLHDGVLYVDFLLKGDLDLKPGEYAQVEILKEELTAWQEIDQKAKALATVLHKNGVKKFTYAQAVRHVLETEPQLYARYRQER